MLVLASLWALTLAQDTYFPSGLKSSKTLNNGVKMPIFGIGTWKSERGDVKEAVKYAIKDAGYIHVDTAWIYENQREVGEGIRELISEGVIRRDQIFVTSKIWMTFFGQGKVLENAQDSLRQLGFDYVDQMLLHWPVSLELQYDEAGEVVRYPVDEHNNFKLTDRNLQDVWLELEEVYKQGLARSIGISNFEPEHIDLILSPNLPLGGSCERCTVVPAVNQVELHPSWPQRSLSRYCRERTIEIVAYAPLANPSLERPDMVHPNPMEHPVIREIAEHHGKTAAQVLLRWSLQRGNIVIPKSTKNARIMQNSEVFDFRLSDEEARAIDYLSLDASHRTRMFNPNFGPNGSKLYPFDRDIDVSHPFEDAPGVSRTEL